MQIYANSFKINEKCYFSVISWPICDSSVYLSVIEAWMRAVKTSYGFTNFEMASTIMQIYAGIYSKSTKNAYFSISVDDFDSVWWHLHRAWWGLQNLRRHRILKFINYGKFMQISLNHQRKMPTSLSFLGTILISVWFI